MKYEKFQNEALKKVKLDKISSGDKLDKYLNNEKEYFENDREIMKKWLPHFLNKKTNKELYIGSLFSEYI